VVLNKFDSSKVALYLYIWYDYKAQESYNEKENKTPALRNKFLRLHKCIRHIMEVGGTTEANIGNRPTSVEDYDIWKQKLLDTSFIATDKMFKEFQRCNVLGKKTTLENLSVNSILEMFKAYKKGLMDV